MLTTSFFFSVRFPPPQSICPSGIRRKRGIPRETRDALEAWFTKHGPYPTITEKLILAGEHQLTHSQVILLEQVLRDQERLGCHTMEIEHLWTWIKMFQVFLPGSGCNGSKSMVSEWCPFEGSNLSLCLAEKEAPNFKTNHQ